MNHADDGADETIGDKVAEAFDSLSKANPYLASTLGKLAIAIAGEALKSRRFSNSIAAALSTPRDRTESATNARPSPSRPTRRRIGPWDPFAVYENSGEQELRNRLNELELEQLRDILAEHGMDTDRLAMKWKDSSRVIDRIVDRVINRASKGDAFR